MALLPSRIHAVSKIFDKLSWGLQLPNRCAALSRQAALNKNPSYQKQSADSMTTLKPKWPFKEALVDDAPETAGLYALWDNATLLYVGRAKGGRDTIRRA
jgi:hypothetical protein